MEHLPALLKPLIILLNDKEAEYLLVGGFALRYYGVPRETRDLDLWVPPHPGNVAKIVAALREFLGDVPGLKPSALAQPNRILQISLPPPRIDILDPKPNQRPDLLDSFTGSQPLQVEFLTVQSGLDFQEAYPARTMGTIDGLTIPIVSLEHLKIIKQSGARPKDRLDLALLQRLA